MADRQITEKEALRVLHRAARPSVVLLIVGWTLAGAALFGVRSLFRDTTWQADLFFAVGLAGLLLAWQLISETRKARRLRHTREWTRLERGTITRRVGREITIAGRGGQQITVPMRSAWSLDEDTPVWVGPRIAPGEQIVLVRDSSTAWASPVHAASGPAQRPT